MTKAKCTDICGAQIDKWYANEVKAQLDGVTKWRRNGGTKYAIWANNYQGYKRPAEFAFTNSLNKAKGHFVCGTGLCFSTVTLGGKCVKSDILGNITYGLIGGYLNVPAWRLIQAAAGTKRTFWYRVYKRQLFSPNQFLGYDVEAYKLGRDLWNRIAGPARIIHYVSPQVLSREFKKMVAKYPQALRQDVGPYSDYNDLTSCKPCPYETLEKRHGGQ